MSESERHVGKGKGKGREGKGREGQGRTGRVLAPPRSLAGAGGGERRLMRDRYSSRWLIDTSKNEKRKKKRKSARTKVRRR